MAGPSVPRAPAIPMLPAFGFVPLFPEIPQVPILPSPDVLPRIDGHGGFADPHEVDGLARAVYAMVDDGVVPPEWNEHDDPDEEPEEDPEEMVESSLSVNGDGTAD